MNGPETAACDSDGGDEVEVVCAFCSGKGKDPFGLLSPISVCQVCGGTGRHCLKGPTVPCPFCGGRGVHPHSRLTCTVCKGIGALTRTANVHTCPECKGSGRGANAGWPDSPLPCSRCGGKGFLKAD
jgi:DnaJ-class molecular chaperone